MRITARLQSSTTSHGVTVATDATIRELAIPAKAAGRGSAVNGGELLMAALATCYCNDVFREAARLGIAVDAVEVEASGEFQGVGLAATNVTYRARVSSPAGAGEVERLLQETDAVAEVHNTLRRGSAVTRVPWPDAG